MRATVPFAIAIAFTLACGGAGPDLELAERQCERLAFQESAPCTVVVGNEVSVGPAEVKVHSVTRELGTFSSPDENTRRRAIILDVELTNPTSEVIASPHLSWIRRNGTKSFQVSANERPALAEAGGDYVETFFHPKLEPGSSIRTLWVFPIESGPDTRLVHVWLDERGVDENGRRTRNRLGQHILALTE